MKLSHIAVHKTRAYSRYGSQVQLFTRLGLFGMSINQAGIGETEHSFLGPKILWPIATVLIMNETVLPGQQFYF